MIYGWLDRGFKKFVQFWNRKVFIHKGIKIGTNCYIHHSASLEIIRGGNIELGRDNIIMNGCLIMSYGGCVIIGNHCNINPYSVLYGHGKGLRIGNNVLIASHCVIIPSNHRFKEVNMPIDEQGEESEGIIIENNVWIGAGCQILDGVTIGQGAIVAAGSVVTKSIPPNAVAAGVPAIVIRYR